MKTFAVVMVRVAVPIDRAVDLAERFFDIARNATEDVPAVVLCSRVVDPDRDDETLLDERTEGEGLPTD